MANPLLEETSILFSNEGLRKEIREEEKKNKKRKEIRGADKKTSRRKPRL